MPDTIESLLRDAREHAWGKSDETRLDVEILLAHVIQRPRTFLYAWPDFAPDAASIARFGNLLARRRAGEPVAYILGQREFWSLPLAVSRDTLIPRPDTELLVECALALIPADAAFTVADLGTGSGAIALALASERGRIRVVATDTSRAALDVARGNAFRLGFDNVEFRRGSWLKPLEDECRDMIVSNPPYVARDDPHLDARGMDFEPRAALIAGMTGLEAIEAIARDARRALRRGGRLLLEHGFDQRDAVAAILGAFGYEAVECHRDASNHDRVTTARKPV